MENELCFCNNPTIIFARRELKVADLLGKVLRLACAMKKESLPLLSIVI